MARLFGTEYGYRNHQGSGSAGLIELLGRTKGKDAFAIREHMMEREETMWRMTKINYTPSKGLWLTFGSKSQYSGQRKGHEMLKADVNHWQ